MHEIQRRYLPPTHRYIFQGAALVSFTQNWLNLENLFVLRGADDRRRRLSSYTQHIQLCVVAIAHRSRGWWNHRQVDSRTRWK